MNAFMRYDKARNSLPFFAVSGCPANLSKKYIADIEMFVENSWKVYFTIRWLKSPFYRIFLTLFEYVWQIENRILSYWFLQYSPIWQRKFSFGNLITDVDKRCTKNNLKSLACIKSNQIEYCYLNVNLNPIFFFEKSTFI